MASSLIPLEKVPIAEKSIGSSKSTSIDPSSFADGLESISAVTSWHGSSQLIIACHPGPAMGGALLKTIVKQPVELLATIGLPLFGSGVELEVSV